MKPILRCSELDRILSCPGSRVLAGLVAPREGSEGKRGSDIHAFIASQLIENSGAVGTPAPGYALTVLKGFDAWIAKFCEDDVKDNTPPDWSLEVEAEYAYDMGEFILTGHPDAVAINPDVTEAIIWDYKTGNKPVDIAEQNEQVLGYLVLLKKAYPTITKITAKIVQPLNDGEEFPRVSSVVLACENEEFISFFAARVEVALDNPNDLESGLKQCAWCPAAGPQCPAFTKEIEFMKAQLTPELLAKIKKEPDDALLADFVISARTISRGVDDAEEMLHKRLDVNPQIVAGCGVRVTRTTVGGSYKVNDPVQMMTALKSVLPEPAIAKVVNYPTGKIRDAIAENLKIPKTGAAANTAEKVFDAKFGHLVTQGQRRLLQFQ